MARKFTHEEYAVALKTWPEASRKEIRASLNRQMAELTTYIRGKFFKSGGRRNVNWIVNRSGRAWASVRPIPAKISRTGLITAGVKGGGTSARHFPFLEFGTRGPYVIVPRRASVLRFETEAGDVVFTRRVVHPGIRARAPLGRGVAQRQLAIFGALSKEFGAQLRRQFA